jgi:hypothetical protein
MTNAEREAAAGAPGAARRPPTARTHRLKDSREKRARAANGWREPVALSERDATDEGRRMHS